MFIDPGILAVLLFTGFAIIIALAISHVLIRGFTDKLNAYKNFSGSVNEFILFVSKEGLLQDALPRSVDDPFYERLCEKGSFDEILSEEDFTRMKEYIKGAEAYPDIPFIFSFKGENGTRWYEMKAFMKKSLSHSHWEFLVKNVTMDVDLRKQVDRAKSNLDLLLQNTGDFLWSFDVDTRQITLLTPITDEDGRVIPRSVGVQDIHALLLDEEYSMFERRINARIMAFRASNFKDMDENSSIKLRLVGSDGNLVWYCFRYRVYLEENARILIKGSARRMDLLFDNPIYDDCVNLDAAIGTMLSFPDIRIFCVDRDYRIVSCNQAFALDFKYMSPEKSFGKRLLEVVKPKYYSFIQGTLSEVFESGKAKSWKGPFNKENRLLWFNAIPLTKTEGFVYRAMGVYIQMDAADFKNDSNIKELI
ncbi:MAG: hypothetical protein HUK19_01815 [Fibrobacter sp.]|nr:hypothetical protein [Fibrobacter sp.]